MKKVVAAPEGSKTEFVVKIPLSESVGEWAANRGSVRDSELIFRQE